MTFTKQILGNELYLFNAKGELIFKRWMDQNRSIIVERNFIYDKHTLESITDEGIKIQGK